MIAATLVALVAGGLLPAAFALWVWRFEKGE